MQTAQGVAHQYGCQCRWWHMHTWHRWGRVCVLWMCCDDHYAHDVRKAIQFGALEMSCELKMSATHCVEGNMSKVSVIATMWDYLYFKHRPNAEILGFTMVAHGSHFYRVIVQTLRPSLMSREATSDSLTLGLWLLPTWILSFAWCKQNFKWS